LLSLATPSSPGAIDGVYLLEGGEAAGLVTQPIDTTYGGTVSVSVALTAWSRDVNNTLHCSSVSPSQGVADGTILVVEALVGATQVWTSVLSFSAGSLGMPAVTTAFQTRSAPLPSSTIAHTVQFRVRAVYPGNGPSGSSNLLWAVDEVTVSVVPRTLLPGVTLVTMFPTSGPFDGSRGLSVEYGVRDVVLTTLRHCALCAVEYGGLWGGG
jgi:hypothetical protein